MKIKQVKCVILLIVKITLPTTNQWKRLVKGPPIDMFIDRGILKYNQITLFPLFTFILQTDGTTQKMG